MTRWRLKTDRANNRVAIYSIPTITSTDNAPLSAPFSNKGRLQLHTDAIFPSTTPENATAVTPLTKTVTVTVGAVAAATKFQGASYRYNLFAHGLGAACMVEGRILNLGGAGVHVDFNGSVPVVVNARGFGMWLALGSTATHVIVEAFGITQGGQTIAATNYTIEASAYDFLETGPAPAGNPALPLIDHSAATYTTLARGKIDTRRRYISSPPSGGDRALAASETIKIIGRGIGDDTGPNPSYVQNEIGWRWRYSVAGYVRQTTSDWRSGATNGGTHNADVLMVDL